MKLIVFLMLVLSCRAGNMEKGSNWPSSLVVKTEGLDMAYNGHRLRLFFISDTTTNEVDYWESKKLGFQQRIRIMTNNWAWNGGYMMMTNQPLETYPKTNINETHLEVYSNTYAIASCDGQTNVLSESHVKLGDYRHKDMSIVVTTTNTTSSESFSPATN